MVLLVAEVGEEAGSMDLPLCRLLVRAFFHRICEADSSLAHECHTL